MLGVLNTSDLRYAVIISFCDKPEQTGYHKWTRGIVAADQKTMMHILKSIPQQNPFRFIDEILELDDEHVVGTYRFREMERKNGEKVCTAVLGGIRLSG